MFRYTKLTALREVLVWLFALAGLLPFYFLVTTSLKPDDEMLLTTGSKPPQSPTTANFTEVMSVEGPTNILRGLGYSVLVTSLTILGLVVLGSMCAYVLARSTRRWTTWAYYGFLLAIILPPQLGLIPIYTGARTIGLVGTWYGLVILYVFSLMPLAVFLYAGFFRGLPREYEESAAVDGASPTKVFFQIVLPLMAPATGTVAILAGLIVWNDFFTALIFLSGADAQTATVAMYYYVGSLISQWNKIFAIVLISIIPILAFYLAAQKKFIQGFAGGIK